MRKFRRLVLGLVLVSLAGVSWGEEPNTVYYCTTDDMALWTEGKIKRAEKLKQERFLVKTTLKNVQLGEPFNERLACKSLICDTDCCDVEASNDGYFFHLTKASMTFNLVIPDFMVRVGRCETF